MADLTAASDPSIWTPEGVRAALNRFKAKADEFSALYKKMLARTPEQRAKLSPELQNKYGSILAKADTVQRAVLDVRDKFNASLDWLKDVTGMSGGQLSAVPIVVAGYVAAVVGATWVLGNTLSEMKAIDREADLMLAGKLPAQTLRNTGGIFGSFGKNLAWPAVLIVFLWVAPKLFGDKK